MKLQGRRVKKPTVLKNGLRAEGVRSAGDLRGDEPRSGGAPKVAGSKEHVSRCWLASARVKGYAGSRSWQIRLWRADIAGVDWDQTAASVTNQIPNTVVLVHDLHDQGLME